MVSIQPRGLVSPWVISVYLCVIAVVASVWLFSESPLDLEGGPLSFLDAFLIFVLAGLLLALGIDSEWRMPMRAGYVLGTVLALGVGIIQLVGLLDGEIPLVEELDTGNTLCWLIAGSFLLWMLRSSEQVRTAERFLIVGFVLQSFSLFADVTDGMLLELPDLFDWLFGPGEEISEVLFLTTYCCGFALLADRYTTEAVRWRQEGLRAYDMLEPAMVIKRAHLATRWHSRGIGARCAMALMILAAPAWFCIELAWQLARNGRRIRRDFGKSRLRQALEAADLGLRTGVPAVDYYKFDLFTQPNRTLARHFVHRRDLYGSLDINALFARSTGARADGKITLAGYCPWHGWPTIAADCPDRNGSESPTPRSHHPMLDSMTGGGSATLQVLTCLDESGRPEITHAVLRMARAGNPSNDAFYAGGIAAAIDLARGKLDWATDLGLSGTIGWIDAHPDSGGAIAGRILPLWRESKALALRAHEAWLGHTVIGWDIAVGANGVELIGGDGAPDLDIIQRTHARPLGLDRLGRLLAYHVRNGPP